MYVLRNNEKDYGIGYGVNPLVFSNYDVSRALGLPNMQEAGKLLGLGIVPPILLTEKQVFMLADKLGDTEFSDWLRKELDHLKLK